MVAIAPAALLLLTPFFPFSPSSPRGNSKYHYYGIRVKPDSPLNRLQEDTQYMAMRQQPVHQKPRLLSISPFYSTKVDHFFVHLSSFAGSPPLPLPPPHQPPAGCVGSSLSRRWTVCLTACVAAPSTAAARRSSRWLRKASTISSTSVGPRSFTFTQPRWEDGLGVRPASRVPFYPHSCLGPALVSVDETSNAGFHLLCSQTRLTACPPSLLLT